MASNTGAIPHEIKMHFGFWTKDGMLYRGCNNQSGWVVRVTKNVEEVTCKKCQNDSFYKKMAKAKAKAV